MPTKEQMDELCNNTKEKWIENYKGTGVNGSLLTAINGKSIFLPAAGVRDGTSLDRAGSDGIYWSSSLNTRYPNEAYFLCFNSDGVSVGYLIGGHNRCCGLTVRPVRP